MSSLMADSVTPHAIPESFRAHRNRGVAPYANGHYEWSHREIRSFPRHLAGIDVDGSDPESADVLDVERFDATPAQWPEWRRDRDKAVKDGLAKGWPKVYTSIAPGDGYGVAAIVAATEAASHRQVERWWIAWYTPGGFQPTQQQIADEIKALTGLEIPVGTIWACQYRPDVPGNGGSYDLSVVYGDPEWQ